MTGQALTALVIDGGMDLGGEARKTVGHGGRTVEKRAGAGTENHRR